MDFTREPIIETIISAKEWHKLVIRNSKGVGQEEYFVDAVEVISFGNASFFRSKEGSKNFLLPLSDYEIIEVRETRMALKNVGASHEHSTSPKAQKTKPSNGTTDEQKHGDKRRQRKKRGETNVDQKQSNKYPKTQDMLKGGDKEDETVVSSSKVGIILPPPTTLISKTIPSKKSDVKDKEILPPKLTKDENPPAEQISEKKEKSAKKKQINNEIKPPENTTDSEQQKDKQQELPLKLENTEEGFIDSLFFLDDETKN